VTTEFDQPPVNLGETMLNIGQPLTGSRIDVLLAEDSGTLCLHCRVNCSWIYVNPANEDTKLGSCFKIFNRVLLQWILETNLNIDL